MMNNLRKVFTVFVAVFFTISASATVIRVDDLGDPTPSTGGTITLRQAITSAAAGDTIMMDVSGQISLSTAITITVPVKILGAYPVHSIIDGPTGGGGEAFIINNINADTVTINGFTFNAFNGINAAISITNSLVKIGDCVFEGNSGTANGQCIFTTGATTDVKVFNSSFFNNSAGGAEGGAAFVGAASKLSFFNCTFFQNTANIGGAISVYGNLTIINNTFVNNTAGTGNNISKGIGGAVTLGNNIFSNSGGSHFANSGPQWTNLGGNVFTFTQPGFIPPGPGDMNNASIPVLALQSTPTIDGYGLKYFRITQQTSPAVDNGVTPAALPMTDCRRAPRILYGDTGLQPDAGAAEFTPYRVTSIVAPNDFESVWGQMNISGGFGGPEYMEFDLPGSTNFPLTSTMSYSSGGTMPRIVDGYTVTGSKIAGPRDPLSPGTYVKPAVISVILSNSTGGVLDIDLWPAGSFISGLLLNNGPGNGILMTDCQMRFFGNHVISSTSIGLNGVVVNGLGSTTVVGGVHYHEMNVIGNQLNSVFSSGINIGATNTKVFGNFVGTAPDGLSILPNSVGITIQPASAGPPNAIGGKIGTPSRNLISGNSQSQIEIFTPSTTHIYGNIIGPDISMNNLLSVGAIGIEAHNNTDGFIGGALPGSGNVIGGNTTGIELTGANGFTILGNFIGISPDPVTAYPVIPNSTGISVVNNGGGAHSIGNGTFGGRNFISGNNGIGIYVDNAFNHIISGNFIGSKPDHNPAGNASFGIHLVNNATGNNITGNVITDNGTIGISLNGAGPGNNIAGNKIGCDSTGTTALPNDLGIDITFSVSPVSVNNNIISGNTNEGIKITSTAGVNMNSNVIGITADGSGPLTNGSFGIYAAGSPGIIVNTNIVAANGNHGIALASCSGFSIDNNYVGLSGTGTPFGNNGHGIELDNSSGAIGTGTLNFIANNNGAGVYLTNSSDSVAISGNAIFNNAQLGISLNNPATPLANDFNDADATSALLANKGQNYPVLITAQVCNTSTTSISGTMNVDDATADYHLEFFRVSTPDASGHGEGDSLIQTATINAGGLNTFPFTITLATALPVGTVISATCTKELGAGYFETSEFSDTIAVRGGFTATTALINNVLCNGGADGAVYVTHNSGIAPVTFQWYNAGSGTIIAGEINDTLSNLSPGSYYCIVTDGTACSAFSDTISVTEPVAASYTYNSNWETCAGMNDGSIDVTVDLGGTPNFNIDWYNSTPVLLTTNPNIGYSSTQGLSSLSPGNYYAVITDANGCIDTLNYTINAGQSVTAAFSSTGTTACVGSPVTFNDASSGSASVTGWSWDFGDANTSSAQNPSHTYSSSGTFTVQLIAFVGTCTDTSALNVTVNNMPVVNAGPDVDVCRTGTVFITLNGSGVAGSFNWSTSGTGSWVNGSTLTPDYYFSGADISGPNTTLYLTGGVAGCPAVSDSLLVTYHDAPTAFAGTDISICAGGTASPASNASNFSSVLWTNGGGTYAPNNATVNITYSPSASEISAGSVDLYLTASATVACPDAKDTITITILPSPTAIVSGGGTFCTGDPNAFVQIDVTGTGPWSADVQQNGSPYTTLNISSSPYFYNPGVSGTYTISSVTDGGNSCTGSSSGSVVLNIIAAPDSSFSYSQNSFCLNAGNQLPSAATTGGIYSVVQAGLTINTSTGEINPATSATGTYDVVYTITSPCFADDTIQITILPVPDANFTTTTPYCANENNDTLTAVTPGGNFTGPGITDGTLGIFDPGNAGPGTHLITYTVTDANGCTSVLDNPVVVNANPVVTLDSVSGTFCTSDPPITLTATPAGGAFTHNTSILFGGIFDPSTASPGIDTLGYVYYDINGCPGFDFQIIVITTGPAAPTTASNTITYCQGSTINPLVVTPGGSNTVNWYSDAGLTNLIGTGNTLALPQSLSGTNTYYATQTAGSCTSPPTVITVTVIDGSLIDLGGPYSGCPDQPVQLNVVSAPPGGYWSPGVFLNDSTILNPVATLQSTTVFYFFTAVSGCPVSDSVLVTINPDCLDNVHNAFSPNGDNINDTWIIEGAFVNTNNRVTIFNRWGDKLIDLQGYDNVNVVWDGTYKGNALPTGTYFYVIEYFDLRQQFSGWVQLTR